MAAKILQQIGATLNGLIQVEALDAAGRARDETVALGEHNGWFVICLHKARGHNAHYTLAPAGVIHHRSVLPGKATAALDHLQGLFGNLSVDIFSVVVVLVDFLAYEHCLLHILGGQQLHGQTPALHTPGGVDAGAYLEDYVVDADVPRLQIGQVYHGEEPLVRVLVELLEPEVREGAVLAHHGNEIRRYTHHQQVKQRYQTLERHAIALRISLHKLETHAAAGQIVERIVTVFSLGIEHRHHARESLFRKVMVADYHFDSAGGCVLGFVNCLDAAVKRYDELEAAFDGPVNTLVRHSVTLVVQVGDVEIDVGGEASDKRKYQSHGSGAVHVVITVNQYLLTAADGLVQALYGYVHIFHQERIV